MQFQAKTSAKSIVIRLLIPFTIGAILFSLRRVLVQPWCAVDPSPCVIDSVNSFDRLAFQFGSVPADFASNVLQNTLGAILFGTPLFLALLNRSSFLKGFFDSLQFLVVVTWNFASIELVRSLVQRPRPLVFRSPLEDGANIHQYTSFYSGHTSFSALATLSFYFYACEIWPERKTLLRILLACSILIPFVMATLRVWGGRHYPTDTICGAIAGWSIAWAVHRFTRPTDVRIEKSNLA